MTPNDELTGRLRATFLQELEEQVQELNSALLELEQRPGDEETVQTLFRAAHTIKGAARVTGVDLVEQACHALESVFAGVRDGRRALDGSDFSLLFAVVDALSDAGTRLRADEPLQGTSLDRLVPRITDMSDDDDASAPATHAAHAARNTRAAPAAPAAPALSAAPAEPAEPGARDAHEAAVSTPAAEMTVARRQEPAARDVGEDLVRVRADRLDSLLAAVGELIITTGRIVERNGRQDEDARRLDGVTDQLSAVVRQLRLRPFADVCEALPRAVRDVASAEGKQVELVLEGQEVEADRMVVDALRDPLLHLVRNAVDHGIEPPDARARAGKPAAGRVTVAAALEGGRLQVTVADDGAGLDEATIRATLRERGMPDPKTPEEMADALLAGRFSTRRKATTISGRGVGVDIARSAVERIGGTLSVEWREGAGTMFRFECPPTPASIRALLVRLGSHTFAIPTAHVERLRRVQRDELRQVDGRSVVQTSTGTVAVHSLAGLLGPPLEARAIEDAAALVIVSAAGRRAGLIVDQVIDEDEIMVRLIAAAASALPYAAGAAVLPSGRVALVLSVAALLGGRGARTASAAPAFRAEADATRARVLVADDSITTRTLVQSVLETAGYDVITAVDGEDAWQRLAKETVDIVVADVEMPRMDGFGLCRRVRASSTLSSLPIVLVTGLSSDEDRARGMEAGADAYIVKSSFDQADLLGTVDQLIGTS
ncbi:hybrid sensor histidine kinase/response regulator [soil metagenome]